jgi:cell division septal protein FtsQ
MTTYAPAPPRGLQRRAPIDPRVRARRVAVTREAGRRRLRRILWVLGAFAVAGAGTGAVVSPLLDVNQIAVVGVDGAHAAEVRAAAGVDRGEALLLLDTGAVVKHVAALSWVADVHVARQLPGTLRIDVTPRFAVAWRATDGGGFALLDSRGALISTVPAPTAGLPEVAGTGHQVQLAAKVSAALSPTLRAEVASVAVAGGQVRLLLISGSEVRFGDAQDLAAKVRATEVMLTALGPTRGNYLNVSDPSSPTTG